jgi:hypothetical protein
VNARSFSAAMLAALRDLASEAPLTAHVRGGCMEPLLSDGARVRIAPRRYYWPGDVVAFRDGAGSLVAHRVVGYWPAGGGWRLLTAADRAGALDSPVARSAILGRLEGDELAPAVRRVPLRQRVWAMARGVAFARNRFVARWRTRLAAARRRPA